jgi:hypothetical protein
MTITMRKKRNSTPWQPHELKILADIYPTTANYIIKERLNNERSISAIHKKAKELGMAKDYKAASRAQFKKGLVPWNKGIPKSTGTHPNNIKHQFKKGRPPQENANYRPIGSIRFYKRDGLLYRKVTDDRNVSRDRRWEAIHRLVWIEAHGPIPPGYIVRFKKGQKTIIEEEITLDKIECIPRSENIGRNGYWQNMPREVAELFQLKSAINRKINKIINPKPTKPNKGKTK